MHQFLSFGLAAGFALLFSFPVLAEDSSDDNAIVVTATRSAQTADDTLAAVSVISRTDIDNTQAESIVELLQHEAGIDILRSGGPAQQTSLFMRGTNSDHTLVLIDGMPVSSATTGAYQWENLSLNEIERIEIVRGPRSALYGSEAIGGVIQIFTRKEKNVEARITHGSFSTSGVEASGGFGDRYKLRLNASHRQSDGYSATTATPDNDGYVMGSAGLGLDARISDTTSITVNGQASTSNSDYDTGKHESKQQRLGGQVRFTPGADTSVSISAGLFDDELNTISSFPSLVSTHRQTAGLQWNQAIATKQMLTMGVDYRQDRGRNINTSTSATVFDNTIDNSGVYLNWGLTSDHSLEIGGRLDTHSQFGNHATGQIAWGKKLSAATRIYASYGTGFKAPDLNELYHPGYSGFYAGNTALQPERSRNLELGLKFDRDDRRINASLFYNRIDDLIDFQGTNNQAINVSRALVYGLEVGYRNTDGAWTLDSNLTLQRALDESTGKALLRRPNGKVSTRLIRKLASRGSFMTEILFSSGHADVSSVTIPPYSVLNLSAQMPLTGRWSLEGRINNLMDKRYEVISGYNTTPRSYLVSARYRTR